MNIMDIPEHKLLWIAKSFLQRIPEIVVQKDKSGNIECNVDNLQLITAMGTALMHIQSAQQHADLKITEVRKLINESDDQAAALWQSEADPHQQGVSAGLCEALNIIDHIFGEPPKEPPCTPP